MNSRTTETGASVFLSCMAERAGPCSLLRNSRKTERGAKQFLNCTVDAPHPLRFEGIDRS
jgi:hypothetical protein